MKFVRRKIIIGLAAIIVLSAAFFWGGGNAAPPAAPESFDSAPSGADVAVTSPDEPTPPAYETPAPDTDEVDIIQVSETPAPPPAAAPETPAETEPGTPGGAAAASGEAEPEAAEIGEPEQQFYCSLAIRCDTLLENLDQLAPGKAELVPETGLLFSSESVAFLPGESAFDVLLRAAKENRIHLEFVSVPLYNSAYIEGIANLYEFDCGELSGWVYTVNGAFPQKGCSLYELKDGDSVVFLYTCDYGADVGGRNS